MFVFRATAAALFCALAFSCLTLALEEASLTTLDRQAELRVHAGTPSGLLYLMNALSFIGASWPMAVLTLTCAIFCLQKRAPWAAGFVAACPTGASLLDTALKHLIHRHRPHLWPHAAILNSYSFPSGHATISSAFFAGTTYVVWKLMGRRVGQFATAVSTIFIIGIGFSRVYLGVHWPSDVIAGYALGLGWVFILMVITESLMNRTVTHPV